MRHPATPKRGRGCAVVMAVAIVVAACSSSSSSGDWRVLVDVQGKLPAEVVVASTRAELDATTVGLPPADIDLATEVAIGLALSGPPGCEMRVVRVEYRRDERIVQPIVALPKGPCSAVAIGRVAIVAVPRAALPTVPFTVQTRFTHCERGCLGAPLDVRFLGAP